MKTESRRQPVFRAVGGWGHEDASAVLLFSNYVNPQRPISSPSFLDALDDIQQSYDMLFSLGILVAITDRDE